EAEVLGLLGGDLAIAAVNRPDATVVSGSVEAIDALAKRLDELEVESTRVHIRVAAHSPMVEPILGAFRAFVRTITLPAPRLPFISNVTGTWIRPEQATDPEYWVRHLRQTVRFSDGIEALVKGGSDALIEVGPGR